MIPAQQPATEIERLAALAEYRVLDTVPELGFDDLTALAASVCNTPIALVTLIDAHRQWFKSRHGLALSETSRELSFCAHAILQTEPLVVPDVTLDARFHDNPIATAEPQVRFYAGTPLIDSAGHALGTLCVIDHVPRTLTDAQLGMLVRLGRQVVAQLELRLARDQAHAASRAKSEFLASMSHEIRTPLNGVLGMSELLNETRLSDDQRELVGIVQRSGRHLLAVVDDILDYSRLEAGQVHIDAVTFDLHEQVREAIASNAGSAKRKGIDLQLRWDLQRSPYCKGDPLRVRRVLQILIANAIKFTSRGSVIVHVADDNIAQRVQFAVTDTGIGILDATLPTLFASFTQGDSSLARQFGGCGMGLAIVRQLVELMNGNVGVESEIGRGSRFWCSLPLSEVVMDPQASRPSPGGHQDNVAPSGYSVLVVDDDPVSQTVAARLLRAHDCTVTVASSGAAALTLCKQQRFDLILMDCMMPEMDGYQSSAAIRALPQHWCAQVPIIAMTADTLHGSRECRVHAGMTDRIFKPITRAALAAALMRARVAALTAPNQCAGTPGTQQTV